MTDDSEQFEILMTDKDYVEFANKVLDFGRTTKYQPREFVVMLELVVLDLKKKMGISTHEPQKVSVN